MRATQQRERDTRSSQPTSERATEDLERWARHVAGIWEMCRRRRGPKEPVRVSEMGHYARLPIPEFERLLVRLEGNGLVYLVSDEPRPEAKPERRQVLWHPSRGAAVHYVVWLGRKPAATRLEE